jgi:cell division transport system permease protein
VIDRIAFIFGEALQAIRRNLTMTYAAIVTVALALFLMGGIGYLYWHLDRFSDSLTGRFEMRAYLDDTAPRAAIGSTAKRLREIPGVRQVQWIPRDKAWQRERLKYRPEVTAGLENPLPEAFKVLLTDLNEADRVAKRIRELPHIDPERPVDYLRDEQAAIAQVRSFLRWLASSLGALLVLTSGILIYNAIRLAVFSRRREARVMRLVGASRFTVQIPYVLEGVFYGAVGGGLATLLLFACQRAIEGRLLAQTAFGALPPFPVGTLLPLLMAVGATYGLLCSLVALRLPMKP